MARNHPESTEDTLSPPQRLSVCAYARVSTDKDDQTNSYDSQVRYFSEFIRRHEDWNFAGIYADEGITGTSTKKRAGFNQMMLDAKSGKFDMIITKEVSRFARNTVDTLSYTRELKKHGVYVMFMNDNISTKDNDGELRLSIMATIAQDESRKTSERVRWGHIRRMEQGVVFGRDMLGYSVKNGKLYLKEREAETVRLIFHKFLHEGKGACIIARELEAAGIRPMQAQKWSNTAILRILRNEKYVGDLCQKKTITPNYLDHEKKYNHGEEKMVYIRDHHPDIAIIDRETWNAVQTELSRRSPGKEQKKKHSNRYWCSGKLVCGECGQRFVSRTKKLKNESIYKAWRCAAAASHGAAKTDEWGSFIGCTGKYIGDRTLRELTAYAINSVRFSREAIKQSLLSDIKEILATPSSSVNINKIIKDLEAVRAKKVRVIDLAADGSISACDLKAQNDVYDREIEVLNRKLKDAEQAGALQSISASATEKYIGRIDSLVNAEASNDEILKEALEKAVIYRDKVADIYLGFVPFGFRMKFETSGKLEKFKVEVKSIEPIDKIED